MGYEPSVRAALIFLSLRSIHPASNQQPALEGGRKMKIFRNIYVAALLAVPFASLAVATSEASPRDYNNHGYNNHGDYSNGHKRGYAVQAHFVKRLPWYRRMHVFRRDGFGRGRHEH
jgi:hypothetical protein